jgi:hypothetical protein
VTVTQEMRSAGCTAYVARRVCGTQQKAGGAV